MNDLVIDPEFAALIPPLKPEERAGLESSLRAEGCRDALVLWAGHNILLDGHNRHEICQRENIPFRTVEREFDSREAATIWIIRNQFDRRNLSTYERGVLALRLKPLLEASAKANSLANLKQCTTTECANFHTRNGLVGRVNDVVAEQAGISGRQLSKIEFLQQRATPEAIDAIKRHETNIDREYKRIRMVDTKAVAIAAVEAAVLEPSGKYHVQIADFPWPYKLFVNDPDHRGKIGYPSMELDEISAYLRDKVLPFFYDDAILWLWTTNTFWHDAVHLITDIGFEHKTTLTWAKDIMGLGDWLRGQTEHCLLAVRGHPVRTLTNQTTLLLAPRREHSRKPDEFYALVRSLCPGRIAEHFARERREGFDCIGAELDKFENEYMAAE